MRFLIFSLAISFSVIASSQNLDEIVVSIQHPIYSCVFVPPGKFSEEPPHTFQLDQSMEALALWQKTQDEIEQVLIFLEVGYTRSTEAGICYPPSVSNSKREFYYLKSSDVEWLNENGIYIGE